MASAGPYASLHLAPDRQPCQHPTTQFFTGRMPFLSPNQQCQSTEGNTIRYVLENRLNLVHGAKNRKAKEKTWAPRRRRAAAIPAVCRTLPTATREVNEKATTGERGEEGGRRESLSHCRPHSWPIWCSKRVCYLPMQFPLHASCGVNRIQIWCELVDTLLFITSNVSSTSYSSFAGCSSAADWSRAIG